MKQAVTHDELVKFAAEKLGIENLKHSAIFKGEKKRYWYQIEGMGIWTFPDLTSWDLMGKGLVVFWTHKDHHFVIECPLITLVSGESISSGNFNETGIADIPLAFWEAWYKLEHRNSVDNPTQRSIERTDVST